MATNQALSTRKDLGQSGGGIAAVEVGEVVAGEKEDAVVTEAASRHQSVQYTETPAAVTNIVCGPGGPDLVKTAVAAVLEGSQRREEQDAKGSSPSHAAGCTLALATA